MANNRINHIMVKRTLCFSHPAYLFTCNGQLVAQLPGKGHEEAVTKTIPIEDIGWILLDHSQITITQGLIERLLSNNTAIITCDSCHMPIALQLPLSGNGLHSLRFRCQLESSLPLRKQLWQQTVQSKIANQASVLQGLRDEEVGNMRAWSKAVKSDDSDNLEGRAAAFYWSRFFPSIPTFVRGRDEAPPNGLLNYGYAILRAIVARALVCAGLLPVMGIHHRSQYNDYCLADDIMEPYRPYVDFLVAGIVDNGEPYDAITTELKQKLLILPTLDVHIAGHRSPLMVAVSTTVSSLVKCFLGESRKLIYPEM